MRAWRSFGFKGHKGAADRRPSGPGHRTACENGGDGVFKVVAGSGGPLGAEREVAVIDPAGIDGLERSVLRDQNGGFGGDVRAGKSGERLVRVSYGPVFRAESVCGAVGADGG